MSVLCISFPGFLLFPVPDLPEEPFAVTYKSTCVLTAEGQSLFPFAVDDDQVTVLPNGEIFPSSLSSRPTLEWGGRAMQFIFSLS